jgi:hypothetical protein
MGARLYHYLSLTSLSVTGIEIWKDAHEFDTLATNRTLRFGQQAQVLPRLGTEEKL